MSFQDKYKQSGISYEIYSDFLSSFIPHPHTKQITRKINSDAVKQSLKNLILTNRYERPRQPTLGGNIHNYLFEPFSRIVEDGLKDTIKSLIENFEPRIKLLEIQVNSNEDQNLLEITIFFNIITSSNRDQLNLTLYRIR